MRSRTMLLFEELFELVLDDWLPACAVPARTIEASKVKYLVDMGDLLCREAA
jgi:hypothetical protein